MPSNISEPTPFYIPSVDITPYLKDPTTLAAQAVIDDIRSACLSTGFFQLLGHGVPVRLQSGVFEAASRFFALPSEAKLPISLGPKTKYRGYDVMASQSYEEGVLPDLKEGLFMGEDVGPNHPHVRANRYFGHPNLWPQEGLIDKAELQDPLMAYYNAMNQLSSVILDLVAATLPPESHSLDDFRRDAVCPMRLLHYPPTLASVPPARKRQLGASAHTDFNAITLLLQDEHEGLEVFDQVNKAWVLVPPNKDAYVVNIGDLMSKMTGGVYKSSLHRVLNKNPTEDRMSVVFFIVGNLDYELRRLWGDGKNENKEPMTIEGWMHDRMNFSYGKHAKEKGPVETGAGAQTERTLEQVATSA
ncbi:MAG: hypothetical protein LQ342_008099 [Letrouitia transgressa]|nr:MAG: hypothetical protein LQ342_008099 [Letrouitia transgressa]